MDFWKILWKSATKWRLLKTKGGKSEKTLKKLQNGKICTVEIYLSLNSAEIYKKISKASLSVTFPLCDQTGDIQKITIVSDIFEISFSRKKEDFVKFQRIFWCEI